MGWANSGGYGQEEARGRSLAPLSLGVRSVLWPLAAPAGSWPHSPRGTGSEGRWRLQASRAGSRQSQGCLGHGAQAQSLPHPPALTPPTLEAAGGGSASLTGTVLSIDGTGCGWKWQRQGGARRAPSAAGSTTGSCPRGPEQSAEHSPPHVLGTDVPPDRTSSIRGGGRVFVYCT